jgi:hypothetical protein
MAKLSRTVPPRWAAGSSAPSFSVPSRLPAGFLSWRHRTRSSPARCWAGHVSPPCRSTAHTPSRFKRRSPASARSCSIVRRRQLIRRDKQRFLPLLLPLAHRHGCSPSLLPRCTAFCWPSTPCQAEYFNGLLCWVEEQDPRATPSGRRESRSATPPDGLLQTLYDSSHMFSRTLRTWSAFGGPFRAQWA